MSDSESIKKMLRSVLQSSKTGVSMNSLQSEYQSLCGETIPLKKLGYSNLEDYLRSIPSVVRLEYRMGQLHCFATVCKETANIAELVAKQKSSKKSGCSHVVNCRMRYKPSNTNMLSVRPRSSLRQPSGSVVFGSFANRPRPHGGYRNFSATGDIRQAVQRLSPITHVGPSQPAPQPAAKQCVMPNRKEKSFANDQKPRGLQDLLENPTEQVSRPNDSKYNIDLVQKRITQVLEKFCSGLWMSKLSEVYSQMFNQKLHPQVLIDLEKWTHICMVEKPSNACRSDHLIYPPLPPKPSAIPRHSTTPPTSSTNSSTITTPISARPSTPEHPSTPIPPSSLPWKVPASTNAPPLNPSLQPVQDILPLLKVTFSPTSNSAPCPPSKSFAVIVSAEVRQRVKELLFKYSHGLWAHALPKLFMDTYKTPFPEHILDNLSFLQDICTVEYPIPKNMKKAILYNSSSAEMEATGSPENQESLGSQQCRSHILPSGLEVLGPVVPPSLVLPSEQYPSVLVTDAKSSNAVTIRFVGENYSNAQEIMEDAMHSFYSQSTTHRPLSNPVVGQLVAVRGEDGDELARAQVMEVMASNKVKVYYLDYGFSVETSGTNVLELHKDFLCLPFQATTVRLAGLEAFSSHPLVLSFLDRLAVRKILLMETIEPCHQNEMLVAVLYDTSEDDDVNINSTCLNALQDKSMNNPLTINATYEDVHVTNVCADGIIYCQLPSRGTARLSKLLEKTETLFNFQMTSEFLVSRPFSGKICLARYKGEWSRVEITTMYGNRVMEVLFIDLGVTATVEVTDLREIPPVFLKDFTIIPRQATKCRLADLTVPEKNWSPEAILWLKEAVMSSEDCKMKILKLDKHKGDWLVYVYLFIGEDSQGLDKSVNCQLAQSEWWHKLTTQNDTITSNNNSMDTGLNALVENLDSLIPNPIVQASPKALHGAGDSKTGNQLLPMPPQLELPQPGQSIDVFVPVACHPGYFVLQPWKDRYKLVVLMGEMILYYNQMWKTYMATSIQKGDVYAAKIDKNWHRVWVKGILANGLVSVYELDYGKHELISSTLLRPLIEEFRQLPFQAITAQLAGVPQRQWSEEASMLFRNHVEDRALVAQVQSVQEVSEVKGELWECRLTVFLVDTSLEDRDIWIHSIMANMCSELSSAA